MKNIVLKGCFSLLRGDNGGGLLVAARCNFEPVLVFEGYIECEVIVLELKLETLRIRVIAGYGPQECAPEVVRETYLSTIEDQVIRADLAGSMFVIAEVANAWV